MPRCDNLNTIVNVTPPLFFLLLQLTCSPAINVQWLLSSLSVHRSNHTRYELHLFCILVLGLIFIFHCAWFSFCLASLVLCLMSYLMFIAPFLFFFALTDAKIISPNRGQNKLEVFDLQLLEQYKAHAVLKKVTRLLRPFSGKQRRLQVFAAAKGLFISSNSCKQN